MSRNIFNSVQLKKPGSNTFNLSHDVKTTFRMGELIPTVCMETLPGDRVRISTETMLRLAPLVSPVMHRIKVTTHFFFVPNRILWNGWEDFITGNEDVTPPYQTASASVGVGQGSLGNYLGLPIGTAANYTGQKFSAFPSAAYFKIYDEYYRDQNLQDDSGYSGYLSLIDGDNSVHANRNRVISDRPKKRAWMHDYFTSALPFAQKGESVSIPLGSFDDVSVYQNDIGSYGKILNEDTRTESATGELYAIGPLGNFYNNTTAKNVVYDPNGSLSASTSDLTFEAATITNLRRAFRLQEWLEKNARGGTRYKENLMVHFGVNSSDGRLQRPEYLGGSVQNMVISEVLSTAQTNDGTGEIEVPVGDLAGHGISVGGGKDFSYFCEEHGHIIGIINVQPVTAYQQGLSRMWTREDKLDYYWPTFQHIGEQEVKKKEVSINIDAANRDEVFGYVPRYAEYKYMNSRVCGEFQSTLQFWHLGRIFEGTDINLNADFIQSNPRTNIFAVEEGDHIYGHIFNHIKVRRMMARYGNPGF